MVVTNVVRVPPSAKERIKTVSDTVRSPQTWAQGYKMAPSLVFVFVRPFAFLPICDRLSIFFLFFASFLLWFVSLTWPNRLLSFSPFHLSIIKMQMHAIFVTLALALATSARPPFTRRADFTLKNGQDAIALKSVIVDNTLLSRYWYWYFCFLVRSSKLFQPIPPARQGRMLVLAKNSPSVWTENSFFSRVHLELCKMSCSRIFVDAPLTLHTAVLLCL